MNTLTVRWSAMDGAAQNMEQLVEWSGGLYQPPAQFKSW